MIKTMNTIQKVTADKYEYMDLLLIADPSENTTAHTIAAAILLLSVPPRPESGSASAGSLSSALPP